MKYSATQESVETFLNGLIYQLYAKARGDEATRLAIPVFADSGSIREILSDPARFPKSMGLVGTLGDSRFNTNGAEWAIRRDLTQKSYLLAGSSQNASRISAIYDARLGGCDPAPEDIQRALMLAASQVFFDALNCEVNVDRLYHLFARARQHLKRLQYFSWNACSASDDLALKEEATHIAGAFEAEVDQSEQLQELMTSLRRQAKDLHNFNPLDELLMNFFAGIETTAATLSFAIDRLAIDPRAERRLYDEILAQQDGAYLNCFVNETLRYFPTIPFVVRETASETMLRGILLPKGQPVLLSIVGLHHDPSNWNEPEIFDCSRGEFLHDTYDRRAFLPFLSGPRMCGGAKLAKLELIEGFKTFIRRFRVEGQTDEIGLDYGLALRPRWSTKLTISSRKS